MTANNATARTHPSKTIFLINDEVRPVLAIYQPDTEHAKAKREMFKTFDPTVKVGDLAVVRSNTRFNLTTVKVMQTEDVEVDFDSMDEVKWIAGVIDTSTIDECEAKEQKLHALVRAAEKNKRREDLKEAVLGIVPKDDLKQLTVVTAKE